MRELERKSGVEGEGDERESGVWVWNEANVSVCGTGSPDDG